MAIITAEMERLIDEQRLAFVATVGPDGHPNVSPKGTIAVWDPDTLVFADLASPGTIQNLRACPALELNVVDPFVRKGYRFRGAATVVDEGPRFREGLAWYSQRGVTRAAERIHALVFLRVEFAAPLISPGYDVGATEDGLRASWRAHYDAVHGLTAPGPAVWD